MLLIYFNVETETTYYYLSRFDSSKVVGESNKFGDILIAMYLIDYLEYKLIPYNSSYVAELVYNLRYWNRKEVK